MKSVYLLLGTNLGDRFDNLEKAVQLLAQQTGEVTQKSAVYETAPWGVNDQPPFLNQVVNLQTEMAPDVLLEKVLDIEQQLGRKRLRKWGERLIDIDILYFEDMIINAERLQVPHPELHNRRFTLVPLQEIAPDFIHPIFAQTTTELLEECPDKLEVKQVQLRITN
jgi:2-amino-4-hydroxy-6-hydroxymethyldihydropteridine diphosphokinase